MNSLCKGLQEHHPFAVHHLAVHGEGADVGAGSECPTADEHLPEASRATEVEGLELHSAQVGDDDAGCAHAVGQVVFDGGVLMERVGRFGLMDKKESVNL